jgi:hypothetical protein
MLGRRLEDAAYAQVTKRRSQLGPQPAAVRVGQVQGASSLQDFRAVRCDVPTLPLMHHY